MLVFLPIAEPVSNETLLLIKTNPLVEAFDRLPNGKAINLKIRVESWSDFPSEIAGMPVLWHGHDRTHKRWFKFEATEELTTELLFDTLRTTPCVLRARVEEPHVFCLAPDSWEPVIEVGDDQVRGTISERDDYHESGSGAGSGGAPRDDYHENGSGAGAGAPRDDRRGDYYDDRRDDYYDYRRGAPHDDRRGAPRDDRRDAPRGAPRDAPRDAPRGGDRGGRGRGRGYGN